MKNNIFYLSIFILLLNCKNDTNKSISQKFQGNALGTTYHITITDNNSNQITKKIIDSVITAVNNSLSTYQPSSLISRINNAEIVKVDKQFKEVFYAAKKIFKQTNGQYDPTIGILVNAWGFGPKKKIENIENNQTLLDSLKQFVGYDMINIDENDYLIKKYPQIFIDYNSIAKGFAVDRVAKMLENYHCRNFLVEIGGEIVTKGKNTIKNREWIIGIDNPDRSKDANKILMEINISDKAMATSGNYRKYYVNKNTGEKYVHTLHPKSGFPKPSNLLSATVIANNCTNADAYATAFMVMGYEKSLKFVKTHPELKVVFVYSDKSGKMKVFSNYDKNY